MFSSDRSNRRGLTLMELVIVMVVLVALAGMIVPSLPSMVSRAHTAAHANNVVEINKAVETYNTLNRGYPDNLDTLLSASGGNVYANLPGTGTANVQTQPASGWTNQCGGDLTAGALTAAQLTALNNAGLTTVWTPDATTGGTQDLLNNPYAGSTSGTPLGTSAAVLSAATAQRLYNEPATGSAAVYAVFGFGNKASIVGHGVPEAPVHFADDPGDLGNPTITYSRFGLVFRLTDTAGRNLTAAQFVGAVAFHPDHVSTGDAAIAEYNTLNH